LIINIDIVNNYILIIDNQRAIVLSKNNIINKHPKRINVKYRFKQKLVKIQDLRGFNYEIEILYYERLIQYWMDVTSVAL
jgi:hypothetical protein